LLFELCFELLLGISGQPADDLIDFRFRASLFLRLSGIERVDLREDHCVHSFICCGACCLHRSILPHGNLEYIFHTSPRRRNAKCEKSFPEKTKKKGLPMSANACGAVRFGCGCRGLWLGPVSGPVALMFCAAGHNEPHNRCRYWG
jgi:hypothetical protein